MGMHLKTYQRINAVMNLMAAGATSSQIIESLTQGGTMSKRTAERAIRQTKEFLRSLGTPDKALDKGMIKACLGQMRSKLLLCENPDLKLALEIAKLEIQLLALDQKYPSKTKESPGHDERETPESPISSGLADFLQALENDQQAE